MSRINEYLHGSEYNPRGNVYTGDCFYTTEKAIEHYRNLPHHIKKRLYNYLFHGNIKTMLKLVGENTRKSPDLHTLKSTIQEYNSLNKYKHCVLYVGEDYKWHGRLFADIDDALIFYQYLPEYRDKRLYNDKYRKEMCQAYNLMHDSKDSDYNCATFDEVAYDECEEQTVISLLEQLVDLQQLSYERLEGIDTKLLTGHG